MIPSAEFGTPSEVGDSYVWLSEARNKKSMTLDLRSPRGAEIFLQLAASAQVVLENFRPGTLESWGLGYDRLSEINPKLVLLRVSGYGQTGPMRHMPGFARVAHAFSGLSHLAGTPDGPPVVPGSTSLADYCSGLWGAIGVLIALRHAEASGRGQSIDIGLYELIFRLGRLAERSSTVTVLEAGPRDESIYLKIPALGFMAMSKDEYNWNFETEPVAGLDGRRLNILSGKIVGGGSSINGLIYSRGFSRDFDYWRQLGCTGWSFSDVLPYFKRSEASERGEGPFHGATGPMGLRRGRSKLPIYGAFLKAVADEGYPIVDDLVSDREGFGYYDTNVSPGGRRMSAAVAYLRPAIKRGNLRLYTGASVRRVLFEDGRAVGSKRSTTVGSEPSGRAPKSSSRRERSRPPAPNAIGHRSRRTSRFGGRRSAGQFTGRRSQLSEPCSLHAAISLSGKRVGLRISETCERRPTGT